MILLTSLQDFEIRYANHFILPASGIQFELRLDRSFAF